MNAVMERSTEDLERALLCALLCGGGRLEDAQPLREDDFRGFHARAWRAVLELAEQRIPYDDAVLVAHQMGQPEDSRRLAGIFDDYVHGRHARWYAAKLRERRHAEHVAEADTAHREGLRFGGQPEALEAVRTRRLRELEDRYGMAPTDPTGLRALTGFYATADEHRIGAGYAELDAAVGALHPGMVVTVLARPGTGKSWLALNLAARWLSLGPPWSVCFASLEMPASLATDRLMRILEGWTSSQVRDAVLRPGAPQPDRYEELTRGRYVLHAGTPRLDAIERTIREHHGHPVRVVLIDYLQYLQGERGESPYERASRLAKEIKQRAKTWEALVVLLCQPRRIKGSPHRCPSLEDARDSGVIEESADVMLGLWRPAADSLEIRLRVLKAREAMAGREIVLVHDGQTGRIASAAQPLPVPDAAPDADLPF
jgi:replicative DNA helicase